VIAALAIAPGASARLQHDPCGTNRRVHIRPGGLHCGGVFEIPGLQTWTPPHADRPPTCNRNDEEIPGINVHHPAGGHTGDWDYWTTNGEWILWNGVAQFYTGAHGQAIGVVPFLHNWRSSPWSVRIFFRCAKRY
jgi:hypothetical protein